MTDGACLTGALPATLDYARLKSRILPPVRHHYDARDTILYALSLGLASDPVDPRILPYVWEGAPGGLRALPMLATALAQPGFWARAPDTGIDWAQLLHLEERVRWHQALPASGDVVSRTRLTRITDRGPRIGAVLVVERTLEDAQGNALATLQQVLLARGNGGYSSGAAAQASDPPLPALRPAPLDRPPDITVAQAVRPDAALLYRLLGDSNPLHVDPAAARAAGFRQPILHGLASYGIAACAVLRCGAADGWANLRAFDLRFSAPVYPGETLITEIWRDPVRRGSFQLRGRVRERGAVVLSHGHAVLAA